MKTVTETKMLFTYDELNEKAQERAINDCINAWMEIPDFVPEDAREQYERAGRESERMQTSWFWGSYIWEYCKQWVLDECSFGYYLEDGDFYKWRQEVDNENKI